MGLVHGGGGCGGEVVGVEGGTQIPVGKEGSVELKNIKKKDRRNRDNWVRAK